MWFYILFIFLIFHVKFAIPLNSINYDTNLNEELEYLTNNFVSNLRENYKHVLSENNKVLRIDVKKQFNGFIERFQKNDKENHEWIRKARSLGDLINGKHESGVHILTGFKEELAIPVNFPKDICILQVTGKIYVAALTMEKYQKSLLNKTVLVFLEERDGIFRKIEEYDAKNAEEMDCITLNDAGYVAIVNTVLNKTLDPSDGSPVFRITAKGISVVQVLGSSYLKTVRLWNYGNELYLIKTFYQNDINIEQNCLIYKFLKYHFDIIGKLPCQNAMRIEPFTIASDLYVAIANFMDRTGSTDTFSFIYKYDLNEENFVLYQKIKTKGATDVKYFYLKNEHSLPDHFLIFANSVELIPSGSNDLETYSIIYKFVNRNFVPFQRLQFFAIKQFLPILGKQNEFVLLAVCQNQDIQVYQYDGWKFKKSLSHLTGESFGKGISNIRTVNINGITLITIANQNLFGEHVNVFSPIYVFRNDIKAVHTKVLEWCEETYNRILQHEVSGMVKNLENYAKKTDKEIILNKGIELQNATIKNMLTKSLTVISTTPTKKSQVTTFDQQFFDSLNSIDSKLNIIEPKLNSIDNQGFIERSNEDISSGFRDLHTDEVPIPVTENIKILSNDEIPIRFPDDILHLDELTVEENLNVEFLNNFPVNSLLHTYDNLELNSLTVDDCIAMNGMNVSNKIDGIKFDKNHILLNEGEQELQGEFKIKDLIVNNLKTKTINQIDFHNQKTKRNIKKIKAKNLIVKGFINEIDLAQIDKYAVKVENDQIFENEMLIENLYINSLTVDGLVSGIDLSNLILTDAGKSFLVNQDIQFANDIFANHLKVRDRINNLKIIDGKFDALLRNSSQLQIIRGNKIFEDVKLLEPIVLQGKIKSKNLEQINPIITIDESITLTGDYTITGNVTIKKSIKGENIYGKSKIFNINDLNNRGLRLNDKTTTIEFNFLQPLKAKNVLAKHINDVNVQNLVKTNSEDIQRIIGRKVFMNDLTIDGTCTSSIINGIDLEHLNSTILRKTGDQVIDGTIHFNKITANRAFGNSIRIDDQHEITEYLYMPTDQSDLSVLLPNVTLKGKLKVNHLKVKNLLARNIVSDLNLNEIIDDTPISNGTLIIVNGETIFNNVLEIENLKLFGNLNGIPLNEIDNMSKNRKNRVIVLKGPIEFTEKLNFNNLIFKKYINSVSHHDFGNSWLLSESNQTFTAEQYFTDDLYILENLEFSGKLNNYDLMYFIENSYHLDREEIIENAIFKNDLLSASIKTSGLINDIDIYNALLSQSKETQELSGFYMQNELTVTDGIFINNSFNYNMIKNLRSFMEPKTDKDNSQGLIIEGSAEFLKEPQFEYINDYNLNYLYENAWLLQNDIVITNFTVIESVIIKADVTVNGLVNGADIRNLGENYFSLTKPQNIISMLYIKGDIISNSYFSTNNIVLKGFISGLSTDNKINIKHFNENVLKTNEDQTITGEWTVNGIFVDGNINGITLNGFNLANDIVRHDVPINVVTANKIFTSISTNILNCPPPCMIQNVDVLNWMSSSIQKDGVNVILGSFIINDIELDQVFINNSVENMIFNPEFLLTKSSNQSFNINVTIVPSNIEEPEFPTVINQLDAITINNVSLDFINNIAMNLSNSNQTLQINSQLNFIKPVVFENVIIQGEIYGANATLIVGHNGKIDQDFQSMREDFNFYYTLGLRIYNAYLNYAYYLDHFTLLQSIKNPTVKLISVRLPNQNSYLTDCIATLEMGPQWPTVKFYKFNNEKRELVIDNNFPALRINSLKITNIDRIPYNTNIDMLFVETIEQNSNIYKQFCLTHSLEGYNNVYDFVSNTTRKIISINIASKLCLIIYSEYYYEIGLYCLRLRDGNYNLEHTQEIFTEQIKQIVSIKDDFQSSLIVLTLTGKIDIWIENEKTEKLEKNQTIEILNSIWITALSYKNYNYIAVCSENINNSVHYGSIEIYRSAEKGNYYHYQRIGINLPKQIEFSILPTQELVLYVLTDNPTQPFVVYIYSGVFRFQQFIGNSILPKLNYFTILKDKDMRKEFIAVHSDTDIMIIEAVMK